MSSILLLKQWVTKQPRPGLVQREIEVHPRTRPPFKRKQWVREEENEFEYQLNEEEEKIASSRVKSISEISGGNNQVFVFDTDNGKIIFKPKTGEDSLLETADVRVPFYPREIAAYELAKIVEMDSYIPITVFKTHNGEIGSAQEYVENARPFSWSDLEDILDKDEFLQTVKDVAFLDCLFGNEDRYQGNVLLDNSNNIVLIDHGMCFPFQAIPDSAKSFFMIRLFSEEEDILDPEHKMILQNFLKNKRKHAQKLNQFLSKEEVAGIFVRAQLMIEYNNYSIGAEW